MRSLLLLLLLPLAALVSLSPPVSDAASAADDSPLLTKTVLVHQGRLISPEPYQGWLSRFKVPAAPGYVDFSVGDCGRPGVIGCMRWSEGYATVILTRRGRDLVTFAHEMGHAFDMYVLAPSGYRERFAELLSRPGAKWQSPRDEERFADAYRLCAWNRQIKWTITTHYGLKDNPLLHPRLCALIRDSYNVWLGAEHPYGQSFPG